MTALRRRLSALAAAATLLACAPALAQTKVDGDPAADDPVGIVADPCPPHPTPTDGAGWKLWNLHMLTRDFGQLCRYHAANAALLAAHAPVRVVFMGDSITDNWINLDKSFFTGGLVDRGISGQTTPQMLVRFREDVIDLHPQAVHIMAGTNDIAGNTGAETVDMVRANIIDMVTLARAAHIKVLLASIPPAAAFPWSPGKQPAPVIVDFNRWLKGYAAANGIPYVDYWSALADADGGMKPGLSSDGVHPTAAGYAIMAPIAMKALAAAGIHADGH